MFVFLCFTLFTFGAADTAQSSQSCDPEPICRENEHYVQESATCQKTCLNNRQANTAGACQPFTGCECDDGFVRLYDNATGPCVITSECDYLKCHGDSNAIYKQCPWACQPTCDAPDAISVCTKTCLRAGCECKLGYIRSENCGYCIQPEDCPGGDPCRGNQTFVPCKAGCPTNNCPVDDSRAMVACSPPYPCPPGCVCKSNHLRLSTKNERCVLTSDCPKVKCTRPNEEWNTCTSNCLAESCSDIGNDNSNCRPYYCQPKCVCKEGFYRNQSDICIPSVGCSCQENEQHVQNSTVCQKTCGNRLVSGGLDSCEPFTGCACTEGFVRPYDNATGTCIPVNECAPIPTNCGYNEEPTSCKAVCPPQSCAIAYTEYICPERQCEPGCNCIENHLRNSSDICILNDDCPPPQPIEPECDINEEPTDCEEIWPNGTCDSICNSDTSMTTENVCTPGCKCIDNYLKDSLDICIPREECQKLCPENENYVQNSTECQKTCGNRLVEYVDECPLYTGFVCDDGYVRLYDNATGPCIPVTDCAPIPTNCGYNEEPTSCKAVCPPQSCASIYTLYMCLERQCEPGCNCIKNHLRNSSQICILSDDCPPPKPWPENEHYVQNSTECQKTCGNRLVRYIDECPLYTGFVCDDGYVRLYDNATGPCIPVTDCAPIPKNCGYNEEPTSCKAICPPQSCAIAYTEYMCPERQCEPGCNCIENHLRNFSEICILNDDCPPPQMSPENEHYVENSTECQKTCGNRLLRYAKECPLYTGYICDDGYVRLYDNATGSCIPVTDCAPIPKNCGYNEEPTSCKAVCPPQSCASIYTLYMCLERQCEPGCNCIENHLRNSSQICILSDDCPPPKPLPENEHYVQNSTERQNTCGNRLVSRYLEENPPYTGFVCDDGYVRLYDNATGPCIPVTDCAPIPTNCGYNEEPTSCKAVCPPQSCAIAYTEYMCPERQCEPGCNCIENHLRNSSEICILNDDCPPPQTTYIADCTTT